MAKKNDDLSAKVGANKATIKNNDLLSSSVVLGAKVVATRTANALKNNGLTDNPSDLPAPIQFELFHVETQIEHDDIEMGVLETGIPYLSESGLARMCGIDRKTLYELSTFWVEQRTKPRGKAIDVLLKASGYEDFRLCIKAEFKGQEINAYTEPVCMALLEYYAFESSDPKPQAIKAYRSLAKLGLREFVYKATGYSPAQKALDSWKHFHDRTDMTMDAAPFGFFGVFREIAIMIVPMIRNGVIISDKVVPDISVGRAWSDFWKENNFDSIYGDRTRYNHEYPDYYPQSKSNPQPSFAYPNEALGAFRTWLQSNYISNKFPKYLLDRTKEGKLGFDVANKAYQSFGGKALPAPKTKKLN